jgi:hypothetical protein
VAFIGRRRLARLRASGVSFEDRQDLLGHRSDRITTHYSAVDLSRLIEASESVCEKDGRRLDLVILRSSAKLCPAKVPHAIGIPSTPRAKLLTCLAGAGGIEPPHGGIKIRCLTAWLRPI